MVLATFPLRRFRQILLILVLSTTSTKPIANAMSQCAFSFSTLLDQRLAACVGFIKSGMLAWGEWGSERVLQVWAGSSCARDDNIMGVPG